jgi:predicted PurR-regulated permease PerM
METLSLLEQVFNSTPLIVGLAVIIIYVLMQVIRRMWDRLDNQTDRMNNMNEKNITAINSNTNALGDLKDVIDRSTNSRERRE